MEIWRLSVLLTLSCGLVKADLDVPLVHASCSSKVISGGYSIRLRPDTSLHWKISNDQKFFDASLEYEDEAWVSFGFSPNGLMLGSEVFVGEPDESKVTYNNILSKGVAGLEIIEELSLAQKSITQSNGVTKLVVRFILKEDSIDFFNGPIPMVYALGETNKLGYHRHRGGFLLDLSACGGSNDAWKREKHEAAFALHGLFAVLATGVALPVAITAAMFRKTISRMWIYLHVGGHCLVFLLSLLSVAAAFTGVTLKTKSHFGRGHHWGGLIFMLTIGFQLYSGVQRPPVKEFKMTDNLHAMCDEMDDSHTRRTMCWGVFVFPVSRREKWQLMHRCIAFLIVIMALCQVQSGLKIFSHEYQHNSGTFLTIFWGYSIFLGLSLLTLRISQIVYNRHEKAERKARRQLQRQEVGTSGSSYRDDPDETNELSSMEINVI